MLDATREAMQAAAALSRGCPDCGGQGITSRFVSVTEDGEQFERAVGCLCHSCDLGRHFHERRQLGEKHFARFIPLIERRDLQHEIFRHNESTRIWLAERDGYCNPRYNLANGQASAWWQKYKTRLARANKERKHGEHGIPAGETHDQGGLAGEAGRLEREAAAVLPAGGGVVELRAGAVQN